MEQTHLLDDIDSELISASHGKRLANYILDLIVFYGIILLLIMSLAVLSPGLVVEDEYGNSPIDGIGWNLFFYLIYFLYYLCFEYFNRGRTIGKMITGTQAVTADGSKLDLSTVLKRSAIRLIPIEFLTSFGTPCNPWHDRWTETIAMDIKKSTLG